MKDSAEACRYLEQCEDEMPRQFHWIGSPGEWGQSAAFSNKNINDHDKIVYAVTPNVVTGRVKEPRMYLINSGIGSSRIPLSNVYIWDLLSAHCSHTARRKT